MPTIVDYGLHDVKALRAVVDLMTPASMRAVCGTGWIGWFEAQERITPEPEPVQDLRNATLYGRWAYRYTEEPEAVLDPAGDVVRDGAIHLFVLYQPGLPFARIETCINEIRRVFAAASGTADIHYFVQSPAYDAEPLKGFSVKELPIRFKGV